MITNCYGLLIFTYLASLTLKVNVDASESSVIAKENQNECGFCDDGKTNLKVDWDNSSTSEYTCSEPETYIRNPEICPKEHYDPGVQCFKAKHFCMNTKIEYKVVLPTYGDSRPVWAHYGEYKFLPPQRGFHNLENGAIVALFHPCANENEIQKLKKLVKDCLRRHIITPYTGLSKDRPFALLSWGWSLEMNIVDEKKVIKFIRDHAITHAPENIGADGEYDYELICKPKQKDTNDSKLCPNYN